MMKDMLISNKTININSMFIRKLVKICKGQFMTLWKMLDCIEKKNYLMISLNAEKSPMEVSNQYPRIHKTAQSHLQKVFQIYKKLFQEQKKATSLYSVLLIFFTLIHIKLKWVLLQIQSLQKNKSFQCMKMIKKLYVNLIF